MGLESSARAWAHRHGLQKVAPVVRAYRAWSTWRFRKDWDDDVEFRGHSFEIGRDLSLYPSVRNGGFEAAEIDALLPRVPRDAVVWDVGANIGIYSVLLASAAPDGRVEAFEPVPETHQRLVGNIARNAVDNVTVRQEALSDAAGTARMAVHGDAHGCDSLLLDAEADEIIEVTTVRADELVEQGVLLEPDVIKVDIEGHEPSFLEGAWSTIERRRPLLMLEVNRAAWPDESHLRLWQETLDRLFSIYGSGDWFDPDGSRRVSEVDVGDLDPHAYTLVLPAAG